MNDEQRIAYTNGMIVGCLVDALGMMSENMVRVSLEKTPAYDHAEFIKLYEDWGVHHNALISSLMGDR